MLICRNLRLSIFIKARIDDTVNNYVKYLRNYRRKLVRKYSLCADTHICTI